MNQLLSPVYYFAYGSNMNPQRVRERELAIIGEPLNGFLENFELRFNKISRYRPGSGAANICAKHGAQIHGVAYQLTEAAAIESMDYFERSPEDYAREVVFVRIENDANDEQNRRTVPAWTYIAKPHVVDETLKPTRGYMAHLLASPFMTDSERSKLQQVTCLDD